MGREGEGQRGAQRGRAQPAAAAARRGRRVGWDTREALQAKPESIRPSSLSPATKLLALAYRASCGRRSPRVS